MDQIEDIRLCGRAKRDLRKNKAAAAQVEAIFEIITERGWNDALATKDIKPFKERGFDGRVFYMRPPDLRPFFFTIRGRTGWILYVTHVRKKAWIAKVGRYRKTAEACERVRQNFSKTGDC